MMPPQSDGMGRRLDLPMPHDGGHPKGLTPWRPKARSARLAERILAVYEEMKAANALPVGPRQVGYRLTQIHPGEYRKADFKDIGYVVKRLQQAGRLDWDWVSDASAVVRYPGGWRSAAEFLEDAPEWFSLDRRINQPVVVEVVTEAKETLPLIRRVCRERGVTVFSGSGSSGPNFARKAALRALRRMIAGEETLILGVGDFDKSGIELVMLPFSKHLAAFLYGSPRSDDVLDDGGLTALDFVNEAMASFRHLAVTPEMALELAEDDQERAAITAYIESGDDMWERDVRLMDHVPKIELEALDPRDLRDLVTDAIDGVLDSEALAEVERDEEGQRGRLAEWTEQFKEEAENDGDR